jgi:DNA ligase-1
LNLLDVDAQLASIAQAAGPGSAAERKQALSRLLASATPEEQNFLTRLIVGELRQGALEAVMVEAIARASDIPLADVRRATMLSGGVAPVARAALVEGAAGLERFSVTLFQPIQPMLAQPIEDITDALQQFGSAALEWKLDGVRVQVHKENDVVCVYSRSLNDITIAVPEIVEAVLEFPVRTLILDGEAIALRSDGVPLPFQETMRRFGRKLDMEAMRAALPLRVYFFDCLYLQEQVLLDQSTLTRINQLAEIAPAHLLMPRLITDDPTQADAFFQDALLRGHEGIMIKSLSAPYEAGSRGSSWLKLKQAATLDLVILAAEWGNGRRRGWLSNLHLGARDPANGSYVMLGKTFKGMTDQMLTWQTETLLGLEVERDSYTVYVRPEIVVEIAFNEVQASSQYPGGLALRFARVKRYRPDKTAQEADTIDTVRAIFARLAGRQ